MITKYVATSLCIFNNLRCLLLEVLPGLINLSFPRKNCGKHLLKHSMQCEQWALLDLLWSSLKGCQDCQENHLHRISFLWKSTTVWYVYTIIQNNHFITYQWKYCKISALIVFVLRVGKHPCLLQIDSSPILQHVPQLYASSLDRKM